MTPMRSQSPPGIENRRRGTAAVVEGRRRVVARQATGGEASCLEVEAEDSDARCAPVNGRLDAQDLARVLTGFRGQPIAITPTMRYVRSSADGDASPYVFDEESGMVYILD
jgi:hypothetical protein